jgi:hypothetical protein
MKRAVSISLGSSKRDSTVELDLLGQRVCIQRIGTDGDMARAAALYSELDGQVDAFGVGGTDLGLDRRRQVLHPPLRRPSRPAGSRRTPVVDGSGLKNTLERQVAPFMDAHIGPAVSPRRVLMTSGADRWGMSMSFMDNGYEGVFGDLMFGLGFYRCRLHFSGGPSSASPRLSCPVVSRLPFAWLYPTGEKAGEETRPSFGQWVRVGPTVICRRLPLHQALSCPPGWDGKIICTNTTTAAADVGPPSAPAGGAFTW